MLTNPRRRRRWVLPRRLAAAGLVSAGLLAASVAPASADSVRNAEGWVLSEVDVQPAWAITQGKNVLVAVIDSGVNGNVSDLAGSVRQGENFSGVSTPSSNPHWGVHGTWMASLIAGHGHGLDDDSGIIGTAPQSRVLSIRVITDAGDPNSQKYQTQSLKNGPRDLAAAIRYAVSQHAEVISMSLGYSVQSALVRAALQDAYNHDVVVVAAAGNSGTRAAANGHGHAPYSYPANYPGVLAVAAVNSSGTPQTFSSQNLSVQVAAPGYYVPAQGRNGQYYWVTGTSPACALTAGVVALIKSKYPRLSDDQVISAITSTTSSSPPNGYNDKIGFGIVDAYAALKKAGQLARSGRPAEGELSSSHFGHGAASTAPPVPARGPAGLILYCLLGVGCLVVVAFATSRLLALRDRPHGGPPGLAPGGGFEPFARSAAPGRHAAPRGSPDDAPGPL